MKKIPCLFVREYRPRANGHGQDASLTDQVTPGLEWVLAGEGVATRKWDGTACTVRDGLLFKRYDAKGGKVPPAGAIPCCDQDPMTGHWPHWLLVGSGPEDRWHREAWSRLDGVVLPNGTYELCGPHFSANPERFDVDTFVPHGKELIALPVRSFVCLEAYLKNHSMEGIVFWKDGEPRCKIKRADFGMPWGARK